MNVFIRYLWIVLIFSFFSPAHAQETLTLCSADSPPWTIQNSSSPTDIEGLAVDIMYELFDRAHTEVQMVALPFKRCLANTQSGELDGCFMTIKNAERETYAEFTDSYLTIPTYAYYSLKKFDQFEWDSWEDLKPYRLGVQRGFKYGRAFTDALKSMPFKIVEVSDVSEGVGMLFLDRIDLMLTNEFRYEYMIRQHPAYEGKLAHALKPIGIGQVYIAISKNSPHVSIVPKLNEIIANMKSDGSLQKIVHPTPRP
ncbi:transporter substrate-binding domain-containing protein [Pseudodesulfovibrio cashew]|uniref:Transporter substrate-binding domain-containing protein n=1 Tax=Pseudodesulfovibrio cashew TaxID=2678688 RepID=A0A6I6JHX6_9BACT|nr:transporter substrate-binding domain-containing protein [Pseudodesulfovibrio cashew]QGY41791.1 transporter substrate-binding domain-containing protein [Pseudodesulfovibrio cashew]